MPYPIILLLFSLFVYNFSSANAGKKNPREKTGVIKIMINQLGYYPAAPKLAVITGLHQADSFYLVNSKNGKVEYRGFSGQPAKSAYSSTITSIVDFSAFQKPGTYRILLRPVTAKTNILSYTFDIRKNVHREAAKSSLKAYYFQRMSTPLEEAYAGRWKRPAGHPDTLVLVHPSAADDKRPAGTPLSSPGGWMDAGDYNKYIVNSGITTSTLLSALQDFPTYFEKLQVNIPETSNRVPDILDETLVNLRWMLTMQDPADGGVYHKLTNADFDGMVMPGETKLPRYVVKKSTAAALNFAAVTAQASGLLKKYQRDYPLLADSCLKMSIHAWNWAKNNDVIYDQQEMNERYKPAINTGAYGDNKLDDEWFWAASELYAVTGQQEFLSIIEKKMYNNFGVPSWNSVQALGVFALLRALPEKDLKHIHLRTALLKMADTMIMKARENAFRTVMGQSVKDFVWGSNGVAANQSLFLIKAFRVSGKREYLDYALSNLDYMLGRNATGYSFLTGSGSKQVMNPHHRPSVADDVVEPIPGLLSGGPNPGRQDKCEYEHTEPETCFTDQVCSYASNEIAINWNAPFVYVSGALEFLYNR